jgi:hypothetical protein
VKEQLGFVALSLECKHKELLARLAVWSYQEGESVHLVPEAHSSDLPVLLKHVQETASSDGNLSWL